MSPTWPHALAGRTRPTPVHSEDRRQGYARRGVPEAEARVAEVHFRKLLSGTNRVRLRSFLPDPSSSK